MSNGMQAILVLIGCVVMIVVITVWLWEPAPKVVKATYLGMVTKPKPGATGRAVVRTSLFGPIAGILLSSAEEPDVLQRFLVRYDNGTTRTIDCYPNTRQYNELMAKAIWNE